MLAHVPVHRFGAALLGFQRRRYVCVHPEGPEGVVQIEHQHLGQGQSVGEGGGARVRLDDHAGVGRFGLLDVLFDHGRREEQDGGHDGNRRYER